MSHTQVRADEATTNHEENNYGLFSLSAKAGMSSGSNLSLYVMIGIAILGIYLQYKSWKASRTMKRIVKGGKEKPSFIQRLCDRGETPMPAPAPVPAPIVGGHLHARAQPAILAQPRRSYQVSCQL